MSAKPTKGGRARRGYGPLSRIIGMKYAGTVSVPAYFQGRVAFCNAPFLRPDSLRFSYSSAIYVETAMYSCYIECENRDGSGEIYEKDSNAVCRDFGCRSPILQLWKCIVCRTDNGENRVVQESRN